MSERKKMTLQDLKDLFPPYVSGGLEKKKTQKGAVHEHKPTWKPAKATIPPAEWKRRRRVLLRSKGVKKHV